jgi:hypothetical protein
MASGNLAHCRTNDGRSPPSNGLIGSLGAGKPFLIVYYGSDGAGGHLLASTGECKSDMVTATVWDLISPAADRPDGRRIFPTEPNFFRFMADHQGFALAQRVFHLFQSDFDFQHLATVCHRKPKYCIVLRRAAWPE